MTLLGLPAWEWLAAAVSGLSVAVAIIVGFTRLVFEVGEKKADSGGP